MAFQLDGKPLPVDVPFSSNGINYPSNWLRLSSADEKKAIGITEIADDPIFDQRFYWSESKAKDLEDSNAKDSEGNLIKDSDGNQVIQKGLKTKWITEQKRNASGLLAKYDWYIIRKAEEGTEIPSSITTYRQAVRTVCKTREDEITACSDVAALKTLLDGTYDKDGKKTAGITEWPACLDGPS